MTTVPQSTLNLATELASELTQFGYEPLLIGALALAVHGYPRSTADVDLAVAIPPERLSEVAARLERPGRMIEVSRPDAEDPLGGVITIREAGALPVQVVNFDNSPAGGFPALVRLAQQEAHVELPGTSLKSVSAEALVFFKLYAGGPKSHLDILELLTRCRVDMTKLRDFATRFRMTAELEAVLAEVKGI